MNSDTLKSYNNYPKSLLIKFEGYIARIYSLITQIVLLTENLKYNITPSSLAAYSLKLISSVLVRYLIRKMAGSILERPKVYRRSYLLVRVVSV